MTLELLLALDDRALAGVLSHLPGPVLQDVIGALVSAREGFDPGVAAAVLGRLGDLPAASREDLLGAASPWRGSLLGRWLLAESWTTDRLRAPAAAELWTELIEQSSSYAAMACFNRARARREAGDVPGSMNDVIECARRTMDAVLLTKAARLLDRLVARNGVVPGRRVRVAIAGSSTTDLMPSLLRLLCARDGMAAEVYCGSFGSYRQELLDPQSGLRAFKPDFIVVALNWRDATLEPLGNAPDAAERLVAELEQLWSAARRDSTATIIQHTFDLPPYESAGYLAAREAGGRLQVLAEINRRLQASRVPGVVLVDCARLQSQVGQAAWSDDALWHIAKQHPAAPSLPLLIDRYARLMAARLGLVRKVLVLDLDNTLWGGVVGEDGPHGIKIGPPTAVGEAHAALQRYAAELKKRGVLLAVCSKNNEADAREPFLSTLGMVLKEDDFVAFLANWEEKPTNLKRLAAQLNLGTDSLVFVDDNPLERAKVRSEMPEVAVVELPLDPAGFVAALDRGSYFESLTISSEDLVRHDAYAANLRRDSLKADAGNVKDFLRRLDMRMHHGPFNDAVQDRVVQLLNKTNQFNVTTRRHGAAEVSAFRANPAAWTQYFRLMDCFGDNGVIGLLIALPGGAGEWDIDTLLMSCRVLGRQAEEFMIATLLAAAKERGITRVRGWYRPTAKNGMVADLFPRLGFTGEWRHADGSATFIWDLAEKGVPTVEFVRGIGP